MSTTTTNYGLVKPALTDTADITAMNGNWDTIDSELQKRAILGTDGKVSSSQLPDLDYVPTSEKGANSGVATLDENGQVPASQLGNAASAPTGAASTIMDDDLTANRALISNGSGKIAVSDVTSTELGYLDGVTSNVQTQFGNKVAKAGDTMTGMLTFNNTSDYHALHKYRTINSTTYGVNVGCGVLGGEGIVGLEARLGNTTEGTMLGRLEIGSRGVSFMDANGTRTYLYASGLTAASVES